MSAESPSAGLQGYDYDFEPSLDNKYMCPICLLALRDPVQTQCGHRFCKLCILRCLERQHKCPVDNVPLTPTQLFQDKYAHREVLDLKVKCSNKGCDYISELRLIEAHAEVCTMRKLPCRNKCGLMLLSQDAVYHEENQCPRRPVTCDVCGQTYPYDSQEQHKEECKQHQPVNCPHCNRELKQYKFHSHVTTECLQAPIKCVFEKVGCRQELPRHSIQQHMEQSTQIHLQYLLSNVSHLSKNHTDLSTILEDLATRVKTLEDEDNRYESNESSRELYNRTDMVNGEVSKRMDKLSVMPPDHSDEEEDEITLQKNYNHMMENRMAAGAGSTQGEASTAAPNAINSEVEEKIISLDHHVRELMAKMETQIGNMRDLSTKMNGLEQKMLQQELRCCNGLYYWKIRDYSRLRRAAAVGEMTVLHSPGFYTSPQGYRMCVRVNLDGVENAQGTHLSLFVHLMKGENDELLSWPFAGVITLTVINQRDLPQERSHISETLQARSNLMAFQRPTTDRNQKGYGYIDFFPLHMLETEGFIKNDTLVIKAQVKVDMPTGT